ncbi:toxin VasX [Xenorhabdus griffiniae]|uniref:toxin VasX n=1 Tax=Xenorhabdus griffiniae TaxID=351672 RepID=UPI0030CE9275
MEKSILTNANDALEIAAKKVEKTFEELVDMAREYIPHDLDMDTVVSPCDVNIRPVYPVRYAYMNFFGDKQINAQLPPPISTFLDPYDNSLNASVLGGYSIRMPRAGWIYVKEEGPIKTRGSQHEGKLLIFKFSPEIVTLEGKRGMVTKYTKYEQRAGSSSWEEIQPASGTAGLGYPFLALNKDVSKISIVYSEVPFSERILDKIDKDESFRRNAMQFVELDREDSEYTIEAKQEHFDGLVEDFKDPEKRFQAYKNQLSDPLLQSADLGDISTEGSFFMDADMEMRYIDSLLCPYYKDKANIVVLHDPVGYQRDILMAYMLLNLWELSYSATNMYPLTIGNFVEILAASKNEEVKKCVKECIHQENWKTWWPKLTTPIKRVKDKKKEILELYKAFFESEMIAGKLGGLTHYFKNFFSVSDKKDFYTEDDAKEFERFCILYAELMEPLKHSEEGLLAMESIIAGPLAIEGNSAWDVALNGIVNSLGHDGVDKVSIARILNRGVDIILSVVGNLLARLYVFTTELSYKGILHLHVLSVKQVTHKLIPKILDYLGLEIKQGQYLELTEKEYYKFLKKIEEYENQGISGKIKKGLAQAESGLNKFIGKKVFDWSNRLDNYNNNIKIKIPLVKLKRPELNLQFKFFYNTNKSAGYLLSSGLSGLDLFMKSYVLYKLTSMSRFDKSAPFNANRLPYYYVSSYANTILGGLIAAKGVSAIGGDTLKFAAQLANKLNSPAAKALLDSASRRLLLESAAITKWVNGGLIATGFVSGALSYYDAYNSFSFGNNKEAYSHIAIGTGSIIMAVGWSIAVATAEVTFGVSLLVALGASLMLGGTFAAIYFNWVDLETLLKNCFWGNGEKYAFWSTSEKRLSLENQFKRIKIIDKEIKSSYLIEFQEFLNYFIKPNLKVENNKQGKIIYKFILPNFKWGESEIYHEVIPSGLSDGYSDPDSSITERSYGRYLYSVAKDKFDKAINITRKNRENLIFDEESGLTTLTVEVDEQYAAYMKVFWYYKPTRDTISPLRYKWGKEPTLENAVYGYEDEVLR